MVALLRHQPAVGRPSSPDRVPLRLVADDRAAGLERRTDGGVGNGRESLAEAQRPSLVLVPGIDGPRWPSAAVVAAVALVILGLFGAIRVVQGVGDGASSGATGQAVDRSAPVSVAVGDQVIVARPGDSLWSIATSLDPDADPRPVVAALIEANGGESVQIGQQIVIPSALLD